MSRSAFHSEHNLHMCAVIMSMLRSFCLEGSAAELFENASGADDPNCVAAVAAVVIISC